MEANQKWLMFVVDGSTAMEPHWPTIFSNYIDKIVRYSSSKWRPPEANCAKVEFGLVMYNVRSDFEEWPIQGSHWTTNEDEFLEKLSKLSFRGCDSKYNALMTYGIAEALVMFPKPPIGNLSAEYFEGERHCIVVPATQPSVKSMAVHVPKIRAGQLYGSHTECNLAHYKDVARSYTTGNNIAGGDVPPASTSTNGDFTVLISEQYREAREALTSRETVEMDSSSLQNPESLHSPIPTNYELFPPLFSDEETKFLLRNIADGDANVNQQNTEDENSPVEAPKLAMDESERVEKREIIPISSKETSNSDFSLLEDRSNESSMNQLNTPAATQISPEAAAATDLQDKDGIKPQAWSSSRSMLLSLHPSTYDEIAAALHARRVIHRPLDIPPDNWISLEQDILNAYNNNNNNLKYSTTDSNLPHNSLYPTQPMTISHSGPEPVQHSNAPALQVLVQQHSRGKNEARAKCAEVPKPNFAVDKNYYSSSCSSASSSMSSLLSRRRKYSGSIGGRPASRRSCGGETRQPMWSSSSTGIGGRSATSASVTQATVSQNGPLMKPQRVSLFPLQNQPSFVNTWEGAISTAGDHGNHVLLSRAKAYRKITAPPTITALWPQWLQISGVIAQNTLDGTSIFQGRVDDLVFEMLMPKLFEILSTKNLCARFNLPSQTLILTPTSEPYRFIGTLFEGEIHIREPTIAYSSQDHPTRN